MTKEITYIRLDPDVKRLAEHAAKADQRSLSAFIAKLVAEWVKTQKSRPTAR